MLFQSFLRFAFISFVLTGLFACASPTKLLENGDYHAAVELAVDRLQSKKKKKYDDIAALELAFHKANQSDLRFVENLKARGEDRFWPDIFHTYDQIRYRQQLVQPLLPLIGDDGYEAAFRFVDIRSQRADALENMLAYYYRRGGDQLEVGRQGDKFQARQAFQTLGKILDYQPNYRQTIALRNEARELGTNRVLIRVENHTGFLVPPAFSEQLLQIPEQAIQRPWTDYFTYENPEIPMDYTVLLSLDMIDVSPQQLYERSYTEEREITDGYRVRRDRDGNPLLDSLGNEIRIPIKKRVSADVLEVYQHKATIMQGSIRYFSNTTGNLLDQTRITTEVLFENRAATFRGDERALSDETRIFIDCQPLPFPTDQMMIMQAADQLRPMLADHIRVYGPFQ